MTVLQEGHLYLTLPSEAQGRKFDDASHGLTHCMKAIDFIVETPTQVWFIEFKDPDNPFARSRQRNKFVGDLLAGKKDDAFVTKFRDSFIYYWAERDKIEKPIHYYVLIAAKELDDALLLARTEELQRKLPLEGPPSGVWQRHLAEACVVFNIASWNKHLRSYPVSRA